MRESPYKVLRDLYKGYFDRSIAILEFGHSQSDAFILWIVAFGVTAISLMVSNLQTLHDHFHGAAKPLIILLSVSICSGLAYRSLSYHMIILYKKLEDYFVARFNDADMTPIEVDPDIQVSSFEEVIRRLKEDFDADIPYPAPLTEDQKALELLRLRKYYVELCQHSRKQFDFGLEQMADIMATAFKTPKRRINKAEHQTTHRLSH